MPNSKRSPGLAREMLRSLLARVEGGQRFIEDGELVLSELVTNALQHGTRTGQLIWVGLRANQSELWIAVEDASDHPPLPRETLCGESGRGLLIVKQLSVAWGYGPREGAGKRVWSVVSPGWQN
ncbi:ATP-binding protein [Kitasatospora sp. NPDC008050]|uniref:ATP-binding protein n=1 Tax=Kitasatospora sp. NPDC008050 TaxID=3364021 RepID=UPI0036E47187